MKRKKMEQDLSGNTFAHDQPPFLWSIQTKRRGRAVQTPKSAKKMKKGADASGDKVSPPSKHAFEVCVFLMVRSSLLMRVTNPTSLPHRAHSLCRARERAARCPSPPGVITVGRGRFSKSQRSDRPTQVIALSSRPRDVYVSGPGNRLLQP